MGLSRQHGLSYRGEMGVDRAPRVRRGPGHRYDQLRRLVSTRAQREDDWERNARMSAEAKHTAGKSMSMDEIRAELARQAPRAQRSA